MRDSLIQIISKFRIKETTERPLSWYEAYAQLADYLIENGVRLVPSIYSEGIEKLNFTKGIYQLLRRNGIKTIEELCSKTMREIRNMRGVGDKAFSYILRTMEEHDLIFAPDLSGE